MDSPALDAPTSDVPNLDSPEILRQHLRLAYEQCRLSTLSLVQKLNQTQLCCQAHADFSPVGWHLGHIAYTEALWILETLAGQPPLFPQYHPLFAADGRPKAQRQYLPELDVMYGYLDTVRQRVFEYLDGAPVQQQESVWRFLLQHESQHCETMSLVTAMLMRGAQPDVSPHESRGAAFAIPSEKKPQSSMVYVPAGAYSMGSNAPDALDNERPAHEVHVDEFWIDRYLVTCRDFQQFVAAGGYGDRQWWSDAAWQWLQTNPVTHPLYWSPELSQALHPVCGVSWYEADAYARFVGKRLPTEAEWEKAARWNPKTGETQRYPWGDAFPNERHGNLGHQVGATSAVESYPDGTSPVGCVDLLGNVWEWTSSVFDGYPGFQPFPYSGYSQAYFDGAHYVLRGGSWATQPWALRPSFRNWYHPWIRQIFAGFRCALDGAPLDD